MTVAEFARIVALVDRLWFGAGLTEAMKADRTMFDEWFEVLQHTDAAAAREAVQALNGEPECYRPPRPGQIARRASEIAASNIVALPDPERLRDRTPEEAEEAQRLRPELQAAIARLRAGKRMELGS